MVQGLEWRFPDNNYTTEYGLDTSDMETFKKDPLASLAREICQNSIDASNNKKPVKVEFKAFRVKREKIPGIDALETEIRKCYNYKKDSKKESSALWNMLRAIREPEISCLRISDFNTTGIEGAKSNKRDTPFYNLTKGSGVSDKAAGRGGSKGIGKFASFVVSRINTVFYSTLASDTSGYIGICKLRSRPMENDKDLLTMGIGYYGTNEKNYPVLEEFKLDPAFVRKSGELGADVFIIGFKNEEDWVEQVVSKILDSFIVAIFRGELEVTVEDTKVSKDTLATVLQDKKIFSSCSKYAMKRIVSQFELLRGGSEIYSKPIMIQGKDMGIIYLKKYSASDGENATNQCVMVRYPYMQIKYIRLGSGRNLSGLCIIERNELNDRLREIENPQHTDWEINRLNDNKQRKKETREMKSLLKEQVNAFALEVLQEDNSAHSDLVGAGAFLPDREEINNELDGDKLNKEDLISRPIRRVNTSNPKVLKSGENGEGREFTKGTEEGNTEGIRKPKHQRGGLGNPNPDTTNGKESGTGDDTKGEDSVLHKVKLSGIRFKTLVQGEQNDTYACVFTAPHDEQNCDFSISMYGDGTDRYTVKILEATINGRPCAIENGVVKNITFMKGQDYVIRYKVLTHTKFSSEVIMHAYR